MMLDSDDFTLFFDKPIVHQVKPLQQEAKPCQLKAPPPLTDFPDSQDAEKQADTLSSLYSFSHEQTVLQPLSKGSDGYNIYSSNVNSSSFFSEQIGHEELPGFSNPRGCGSFWMSSSYSHCSLEEFHSGRDGDETFQDFNQKAMSKYSPFDCVPSLRKRSFKMPEMTTRNDSSPKNDPGNRGSNQTATTPGACLSQVTMTTVPLPPQPLKATVGHKAPAFTPKPFLPQPLLGLSAPSGRLPQAAQHAETHSARRAVVPPMTPQPLHIQGFTQHCHSHGGSLQPLF